MAKKVVTFGEIMLRLAPEGYYRFVQATSYGATYGGGEANVAVSLANYGMDASFVTKLPAHEIGQAGVNALRQYGVDTSDIVRGGDRVGIYFLEKGASQQVLPLQQLQQLILTGIKFSTVQTGSTLPELHRHLAIMWQQSAQRHVKLQKQKESL